MMELNLDVPASHTLYTPSLKGAINDTVPYESQFIHICIHLSKSNLN